MLQRSFSKLYREQKVDDPDFLQVLVLDQDVEGSGLYRAFQKVYDNGEYVGVRLTAFLHYNDIVDEDRFHFDPRELEYAMTVAAKHGNDSLGLFARSLFDFKELA